MDGLKATRAFYFQTRVVLLLFRAWARAAPVSAAEIENRRFVIVWPSAAERFSNSADGVTGATKEMPACRTTASS